MAVTESNYTGDGVTVEYSFPFPFIKAADVKVTLDDVITSAYTINETSNNVQFDSPPGNGVAIRIYRDTDDETLRAIQFPGSAIRAVDLNAVATQLLYLCQELKNKAGV